MKKGKALLYNIYFSLSERGDMHEISGKALFFVLIVGAVIVIGPKIFNMLTTYTGGAGNTISSTMNS